MNCTEHSQHTYINYSLLSFSTCCSLYALLVILYIILIGNNMNPITAFLSHTHTHFVIIPSCVMTTKGFFIYQQGLFTNVAPPADEMCPNDTVFLSKSTSTFLRVRWESPARTDLHWSPSMRHISSSHAYVTDLYLSVGKHCHFVLFQIIRISSDSNHIIWSGVVQTACKWDGIQDRRLQR